ncbi:hypothetical protein A3L10_10055 [Thermococcus radiotolerans]|uniref:Uncharacterized protein n=2 Tax=Thermococcus radiotolerans TaxID=187880 RepID=A0A2Z2N0U2_9EURY|nr:hypothetical protein A3L10_10055 [Thermococcus radiotolerans]
MRIKGAVPMNFSGFQLFLAAVGSALILFVPILLGYVWISLLGWFFLAASWGTSVEVEGERLKFRYFFGKLCSEVRVAEIRELKTVNRLENAVMAREFPGMFILIVSVIIFAFVEILTPPLVAEYGLNSWFVLEATGLVYLGFMVLPFKRETQAFSLVLLPPVLGFLVNRVKPGSIDEFSIFMATFMAFLLLVGYYRTDYIVLKTSRRSYLIAIESRGGAFRVLREMVQLQDGRGFQNAAD